MSRPSPTTTHGAGHGDVAHTHRHARKTSAGFAALALRDGCRGLLVDADAIDR